MANRYYWEWTSDLSLARERLLIGSGDDIPENQDDPEFGLYTFLELFFLKGIIPYEDMC